MTPHAAAFSRAAVLLAWAARAIGPRVSRLLLAQLLLVTLVGGVNGSLVADLIRALQLDAGVRAVTLASIAFLAAVSHQALRHALCPSSLASLRRQPLGAGSFALMALPWALPIAWPWALVLGLAHPGSPLAVLAGTALGTLAVCAAACVTTGSRRLAWLFVPLAAALLVDRWSALAGPVLLAAATVGVVLAGRGVRAALAPIARMPGGRRSGSRPPRTPLGALLALDRDALGTSPHWLFALLPPLVVTLYVVVLDANGNCRGRCLDGATILATTLGAGASVAVLDVLRRVHGARLLVPDRVVPTRLRLASLFLVTLAPLVPFVLTLGFLSREIVLLPHACAVALVVLHRQLRDTTRAAELGPLVWTLLVPVSVVLVPEGFRLAASATVVLALAALLDRRGAALRAELAAARRPSTRY